MNSDFFLPDCPLLCTGPQADAPADALLRNQTLASSTADSMVR